MIFPSLDVLSLVRFARSSSRLPYHSANTRSFPLIQPSSSRHSDPKNALRAEVSLGFFSCRHASASVSFPCKITRISGPSLPRLSRKRCYSAIAICNIGRCITLLSPFSGTTATNGNLAQPIHASRYRLSYYGRLRQS